jgi:hypothetical protein
VGLHRPAPSDQRPEQDKKASSIQGEGSRGTCCGHDEAAERWTKRACQVEADAVQRDGLHEVVMRHQLRRCCGPGREDHGGSGADRKGQGEQAPCVELAQRGQCSKQQPGPGNPELGRDKGEPTVQDVGKRSPGRANRKTGSMAAACTRLTITGEGASEVISHPAVVF